jgi:AcrR family transcriptional regulator
MFVDTPSLPKPAQRILRAATALFSRKGLAGTTTRMIAARARMNEAMIFRYFPTKRHLYAAILECQMNENTLLQDLKGDMPDLETFLKSLAARILQKIRRDPQFLRVMYFSALEGHKLASTVYERTMHLVGGFIAAQLDAAIDRGELRRGIDTHLAARSFTSMVAHHALVSEIFQYDRERWSDEELVNTFTSIFLDGLRGKNQ